MKRAAAALAAALALLAAAPAAGYVAPGARIVSASLDRLEQGDDSSTAPAISADGRSVAFSTLSRNLFPDDLADPPGRYYQGGIFRRDVERGALDLVAAGDLRAEGSDALVSFGARNPSISADGRYVAFSTAEPLVPADVNGNVDVYVRDMTRARRAAGAYELISARDGSDVPARYADASTDRPGLNPGTDVSPATAISADGRRVAFRTVELASDLPQRAAPDTPPNQIFVRDRAAKRTTLVTARRGTPALEPAGGAAGPVTLSADGTTVAWAGRDAAAQTRFVPGENPDPDAFYYLWRRVADGAGAQTRRITGASDPDDACSAYVYDDVAQGPCYGPLSEPEQSTAGITATPPALSADGRSVAFVTGAAPRPRTPGLNADLFVTDMRDGVTRKAGTVELTREGVGDATASAPILGVAMSSDGRRLAVTSQRTRFVLPALRLLGDLRSVPGATELYLVDLPERTVERVVRSYAGGDAGDSVGTLTSLSRDGDRVAFSSAAEDLFFGDANQRTDVFVADRLAGPPPPPELAEPPAEPAAETLEDVVPATRRLRVFVRRGPAGTVRIDVRAPVRGKLTLAVRGRLPDADGRPRGALRRLASRTRTVKRAGRVILTLKLAKRYRGALRRNRGLQARAAVRLTPRSGSPLVREVGVRFAYRAPKKSA